MGRRLISQSKLFDQELEKSAFTENTFPNSGGESLHLYRRGVFLEVR